MWKPKEKLFWSFASESDVARLSIKNRELQFKKVSCLLGMHSYVAFVFFLALRLLAVS